MKKSVVVSLVVLGIVSIICAGFGLYYNISTISVSFSGAFDKLIQEHQLSHFYAAFYAMSSVCILFYLLLLLCGVYFIRRKIRYVPLFVIVLLMEIIYFFAIGGFGWHLGDISQSIAGATGVANGGLMAQFFILPPLWGSVLAIWAKKQNRKSI